MRTWRRGGSAKAAMSVAQISPTIDRNRHAAWTARGQGSPGEKRNECSRRAARLRPYLDSHRETKEILGLETEMDAGNALVLPLVRLALRLRIQSRHAREGQKQRQNTQ